MPSAVPETSPSPQKPPEPWGKLQRSTPQDLADPSRAPRLSLVAHCIDVAAVVAALLALPTWQARLGTLAKRRLSALDLSRLCALAFLHDVGKAGAGFYGCSAWAGIDP